MSNLFDDIELAEKAAKHQKQSKKPQKGFEGLNPIANILTQKETRAATTKLEGKYWLRTVKIPLEWRDLIQQVRVEGGFKSVADAERWVIGEGLRAFFEGGRRPKFTETVERTAVLFSE